VLVKKRFDNDVYLKYSENEVVNINDIDSLQHDFVRETLKFLNIDYGLEIINWADIPTKGTGLGSSSSFLVGLLLALHTLQGDKVTKKQLAEEACHIEIDLCKKPIGYQDQYAAAFGGFNDITFTKEYTDVDEFNFPKSVLNQMSSRIMMFYTGINRLSANILSEQNENLKNDKEIINAMISNRELADSLAANIRADNGFDQIGVALDCNWQLKKKFASSISNNNIDKIYDAAINAGATGGKITGAGGGGFFVFYVPTILQDNVRKVMSKIPTIREMPFEIDIYGSRVLMNIEEGESW
jgi:D-glycero-alpha-D-manno-heptose-7-phosphate kinase